jgi:hypothetical protein
LLIGKCVSLRNHQPFIVLLHWTCVTAALYFGLALWGVKRARGRAARERMRLGSVVLAVLCGSLCVLLFEEMRRIRMNQLVGERGLMGEFDLGERANVAQFLGEGWTRRWWPRVPKLSGLEWALPEFRRIRE